MLDEQKGGWVNKGKTATPRVVPKETISPEYSIAVQAYLQYRRYHYRPWRHDTTTLEQRFQDSAYYYTVDEHNSTMYHTGDQFDRFDRKGNRKHILKLSRVYSAKRGEMAFRLNASVSEFPELTAFSGKVWVVEGNDAPAAFRKKYMYKKDYSDIRLEPNGLDYTLTLKYRGGWVTLQAYPVPAGELRNKVHEATGSSRSMRAYERSLARREKRFDKEVAKENKKYKGKDELSFAQYYASLKNQMTAEERKMNLQEWNAHCDSFVRNERKNVLASGAGESAIIRSLEIDGMGVYNCDQISRLTNPVVAHARYKQVGGKELSSSATYIIDNKLNGVLRYDGYEGYSPTKIAYSPSSGNILLTIQKDGKVAFLDQTGFKSETVQHQTDPAFSVTVVDPSTMSVGAFRELLGYKAVSSLP